MKLTSSFTGPTTNALTISQWYLFWFLKKKKKPKQLMHESTSGCTSLGAQMVKNLPAVQETQVQPLSQEDPLEKGMAIHSSILAWRIPWTEERGGLTAHGVSISQT